MIELQLVDGRVLQFREDEQPSHTGVGPLQEQDIAAIATNALSVSKRLRRGPDFLLSEPSNSDHRLAVELKKGGLSRTRTQATQEQLARYAGELVRQFGRSLPLQLWVLSPDASSIEVSNYSAEGGLGDVSTYYLINVSTRVTESITSVDQVVAGSTEIDTERVKRRLDDWEQRIRSLYDNIQEWCQNIPNVVVERQFIISITEEMMQRYAVPPRALPMLRVMRGKEVLLTFKPYGLWIIGANGRIDILAPNASYFLVDTANQFDPPIWKLFGSGDRRIQNRRLALGVDFTAEALGALLRG